MPCCFLLAVRARHANVYRDGMRVGVLEGLELSINSDNERKNALDGDRASVNALFRDNHALRSLRMPFRTTPGCVDVLHALRTSNTISDLALVLPPDAFVGLCLLPLRRLL